MHTLYQHPLPLANCWVRKDWKEKELWVVLSLSLSFYVIIFSVSSWLRRGSNKSKEGYERVHWSFVFLRMPLPSFCVRSKFWFKWKWRSLSRLSAIPVYLVLDITRLPCAHVESHWTLTVTGPLEFCAVGLPKCCMWSRRQDTHIHCAYHLCSCACSVISLDLTYKPEFEDKAMKNLKTVTAEH